ncbi:unnamed protein product [Heligmosomoides polygyrus]|uniref:DUF190 domain-containing protein n=1 Tax=Heligmosomoides polygyrus TaxID=6339 RepID=A0A183FCL4_HELPZ|nr:unnamed protein product [Heligmosomoides polygyrus]
MASRRRAEHVGNPPWRSRRRAEHVGDRAWRAVDVPNSRRPCLGVQMIIDGSRSQHGRQSISIDIIDFLWISFKRHENLAPRVIKVVQNESEVDQLISIDIIDFLGMTFKRHEISALGVIEVAEHESEVDQSILIDIIDFLEMMFKRHEISALGVIEVAEDESEVGSIDIDRYYRFFEDGAQVARNFGPGGNRGR